MMTNNKKHLYIIGAGFAGQTIADDIKRKKIFGTVSGEKGLQEQFFCKGI